MTDYIILFGATVLAVLAVGFFGKRIGKRSIDLISSFTGAFVIGIIVFHMLPEVYSELPPHTIGLCVMAGLLIQSVLDFFTKGIDHGAHGCHVRKPVAAYIHRVAADTERRAYT